jgi:predicted Zn-dependent peptidase
MHKKKTFPNKSRLIMIPSKDTKAVTVLFLFAVGSRYETREINGASHFIEHLMFKGTKKRPTTLDISKELDRVGAEFNAMTSKDYTGYYVKINHEKVELAVDILSDMLLNSKFDNSEINRERGVVIEEINMYHDNPLMNVENVLEELVFKGSTLGWEIAGPASVIKKVSRKQLIEYRDKYYRPDNMVIVAAGNVTDKVKKLIEEKFINKVGNAQLEKGSTFKPFTSKQTEPQYKVQYKKTKQVQLAMGFPAFGYDNPKTFALHLLSIILGGNMSSRLFISVRERRGLCYFVRCYPNFYQDTGNIVVQSGLDASRLEEAVKVILQELRKVKQKGITAKELSDAKEFLHGKIVLNLEDSSNLAEYYAKQELLLGRTISPEDKYKKYLKITVKDVQDAAREVLVKDKLNVALIGPFKSADKIKKIVNL